VEVFVRTIRRVLGLVTPLALACAAVAGPASAAPARPLTGAAQAGPLAAPVASLVDDIAPGPLSSDPRDLTAMNGELFFSAWDPRHGRQLWKSDGTAAGTVMLTDVAAPFGADPQDLAVADGELFFSAWDPRHGRELWKSDGTAAGTTLVSDIVPGPFGSGPRDITYAIGQQGFTLPPQVLVYFSAWDPRHGRQLWKSDGTAGGTVMITDVNPGLIGLAPEGIAPVFDTTAMFSANDGMHGRELWVTDGTTAGTKMFADLNPGPAGSYPADITPTVNQFGILATFPFCYFSAADGTHGRELFAAYAGSPPPDVYDINPGPADSGPGPFDSVAQSAGLVAATSAASGRELFQVFGPPLPPVLVGPQPGTAREVAGVSPGAGSDPVLAPTTQIGTSDAVIWVTRTYFSGDDGGHGRQLWQADEFVTRGPGESGSLSVGVAGVRLVDDISRGVAGSDPQGFASVGGTPVLDALSGGTEVFSARDGTHGRELWTSDGWPSNTAMAADINPGPASSDPRGITVIGQVAYFTARDPAHGRELWKLTVPPTPEIDLSTPTTMVTAGSPVTVHADLQPAPGAAEPSGRVTFYEDGTQIAAAQLAPDGSGGMIASASLTARPGTHPIVAVYQGDGTYTPATSNTLPLAGS
jgi:ELWxxDGT repeat protein